MNLPPLPAPHRAELRIGVHDAVIDYHTTNELREYGQLCRQQALEEAVKRVKEIDDGEAPAYAHCRDEIRSLIK